MSPKKLLVTVALASLMVNPVYADVDADISDLYKIDDEGYSGFLYLAPTGRYYLEGSIVVGDLMTIGYNSTGTWHSEKGGICIEASIAPYHVFAATVGHNNLDLPSAQVEVVVAELANMGNKTKTYFSLGSKSSNPTNTDQWHEDMFHHRGGSSTYKVSIKPDDTHGYLTINYDGVDYFYDFPIDPKYSTYRVVDSGQIGLDSTMSSSVVKTLLFGRPKKEITSLDEIPSCGLLNENIKKLPPEVDAAEKKEYLKDMVESIDPQRIIRQGVAYTRIPLRFLKAIPTHQ